MLTFLLGVISATSGAHPVISVVAAPFLAAAAPSPSLAAAVALSSPFSIAVSLHASLSARPSARGPEAAAPEYHARPAPLLPDVVAESPVVSVPGLARRRRMGEAVNTPSSPTAVPVLSAALPVPSATPVMPAALVMPPAQVPSMPATPHLCSLHAVVVPLVPSMPLFPTRLRAPSRSIWAPPVHNDPFSLSPCPGASPSSGATPHDVLLPYSAMAPLPAAAAGPTFDRTEMQ